VRDFLPAPSRREVLETPGFPRIIKDDARVVPRTRLQRADIRGLEALPLFGERSPAPYHQRLFINCQLVGRAGSQADHIEIGPWARGAPRSTTDDDHRGRTQATDTSRYPLNDQLTIVQSSLDRRIA
jgi:hypothetical protein